MLRAARMAGMAPLLRAHREQIKDTLAWNIDKGIALTGEQIAAARAGHAEIFGRVSVLPAPTGRTTCSRCLPCRWCRSRSSRSG